MKSVKDGECFGFYIGCDEGVRFRTRRSIFGPEVRIENRRGRNRGIVVKPGSFTTKLLSGGCESCGGGEMRRNMRWYPGLGGVGGLCTHRAPNTGYTCAFASEMRRNGGYLQCRSSDRNLHDPPRALGLGDRGMGNQDPPGRIERRIVRDKWFRVERGLIRRVGSKVP